MGIVASGEDCSTMTTEPPAPPDSPTVDNPYQPPATPLDRSVAPRGPGTDGPGIQPVPQASRAAIVGFSTSVVLATLSVYATLVLIWGSEGSQAEVAAAAGNVAEAERWSDHLATLYQIVYLLTAIPFLIWFHRCYRNLSALYVDGNSYSTGWAVGGWFIPFFNLVRPYQVAREMWDASNPDVNESEGPRGWLLKRSAQLIQIWWALHVIPNFVFVFSRSLADQPSMEKWRMGVGLFILGDVMNIGAAVAAILVIRRLDARQAERQARLRTLFASHPLAHLGPEPVSPSVNEIPTGVHDDAVNEHLRRKRRRTRRRR